MHDAQNPRHDTQDPSSDEDNLVFEEYFDILRAEHRPRTDHDKLLEEALQRRQELRERCLRELWERFGIKVTKGGIELDGSGIELGGDAR